MKKENQINKMWEEHNISRKTPMQAEINQVLEIPNMKHETQENTNYSMYKKITMLFDNTEFAYETINEVFDLENRTELDLKNLKEFILCITLMCGQDVLKAQGRSNRKQEKVEIGKHAKRCDLMNLIIQAIDSVILRD